MKFTLEINCDNAPFYGHENTCLEVYRILAVTARKVSEGQGAGNLFDINGNKVGSFEFSEYDSES